MFRLMGGRARTGMANSSRNRQRGLDGISNLHKCPQKPLNVVEATKTAEWVAKGPCGRPEWPSRMSGCRHVALGENALKIGVLHSSNKPPGGPR